MFSRISSSAGRIGWMRIASTSRPKPLTRISMRKACCRIRSFTFGRSRSSKIASGMVTHWETRERPVYVLVLASPGKLGTKLKPHTGDCNRPPGSAPAAGSAPVRCGTNANIAAGKVTGTGITMETFARNLSGGTGRYIIEKTGLTGAYDLELEYTPDQSARTTGASLFTAMQEQLGLKLDSQRAPIDVLVIDRVERPTAD